MNCPWQRICRCIIQAAFTGMGVRHQLNSFFTVLNECSSCTIFVQQHTFFQIKKLSNFLTHLQDRDICLVNLKYILYTFHLTKANFSQYSPNNSNRYHVTISQRLAGPVSGPVTPSQDESNEGRVPTTVSASHQTTTKFSHTVHIAFNKQHMKLCKSQVDN